MPVRPQSALQLFVAEKADRTLVRLLRDQRIDGLRW
jgi:hypothetical protein